MNDPVWIIAAIRGGHPSRCDFCNKPYIKGKCWPIPEEAGAWSCNECETKPPHPTDKRRIKKPACS
jgi:hypothetical protein